MIPTTDTLNPSQTEAVMHGEGPMLVVAGPGSGKTRVISYRIAHLICDQNVAPESIIAITFTNKAAEEMKTRVAALLKERGVSESAARKVWISTFHSACNKILRAHATKIGFSRQFHIYDQKDSETAIMEACVLLGMDRKTARSKLCDLQRHISAAKNGMIEISDSSDSEFSLRRIYLAYQDYLAINDAMDFDDLLVKTCELFTAYPKVLKEYQNRFDYILVDEYQDTNKPQNDLAIMLAAPSNNICVVGDPDQSIYKFRGADITNIQTLEETFNDIKIVPLGENYRSLPMIVDTSSSLIDNNPRFFHRLLKAKRKAKVAKNDAVDFHSFWSDYEEAEWIAETIEAEIESNNYALKDFAVLYRMHRLAGPIENALVRRGLPYRMSGGTGFFERAEIRDCLAMIRSATENPDILSVKRVIKADSKGIGAKSLEKLEAYAKSSRISLAEAMLDPSKADVKGKAVSASKSLAKVIKKANEMLKSDTPHKALEVFMSETDYMNSLASATMIDDNSKVERVNRLMELISQYETYEEMRDFLTLMSGEVASDGKISSPSDYVNLMTLHAAKGLEFPVVFFIGMEEKTMLPSWTGKKESEVEETRRLTYVGVTRAENQLYITAANERSTSWDNSGYPSLCRFWREMGGGKSDAFGYDFFIQEYEE